MADRDFDEFYAGNYGRFVVQLYAVTGSLPDAEDAVQEAFARASVHWGRVRGYEVPEAWVRRVALNVAFTGLRRARRRMEALTRAAAPPPAPPLRGYSPRTATGIGFGSTLAELRAAYGARLRVSSGAPGNVDRFTVGQGAAGELSGSLGGGTPGATVTGLAAGALCGE
jgi:DNA-directed RNA polymerase specialized sigma24 family protein